jgi:hypothetical protein
MNTYLVYGLANEAVGLLLPPFFQISEWGCGIIKYELLNP